MIFYTFYVIKRFNWSFLIGLFLVQLFHLFGIWKTKRTKIINGILHKFREPGLLTFRVFSIRDWLSNQNLLQSSNYRREYINFVLIINNNNKNRNYCWIAWLHKLISLSTTEIAVIKISWRELYIYNEIINCNVLNFITNVMLYA